jgi:hypothetical protein
VGLATPVYPRPLFGAAWLSPSRQRLGYELRTGVRFAGRDGDLSARNATLQTGGEKLATLTYGNAATLWRINLGWTRRKNKSQLGFVLDTERGFWARTDQETTGDPEDPLSASTSRVIPYVEDTRNCLMLRLEENYPPEVLAPLQSALKNAIQVVYQLEDNELSAEPLPSCYDRRLILFYESAEGGAGVLRRLLDDTGAFGRIAAEALRICHFDSKTGEDRRHAPRAREDCEAACYDCLMTYTNQMDHPILDRQSIHNLLMQLTKATVEASPSLGTRSEHLQQLERLAGSTLEKKWLASSTTSYQTAPRGNPTTPAMTKRHRDQTQDVRLLNDQESRRLPRIAGRRSVKEAGRL